PPPQVRWPPHPQPRRGAMVREGSQHPGEIGHTGAAAAELFRHASRKHLACFQLRIIFCNEGIRIVLLFDPSREADSELIREVGPFACGKLMHGTLLVCVYGVTDYK